MSETKQPPTVDHFWSKVDRSGGRSACWPWTGAVNKDTGYGVFHPGRQTGYRRTVLAHRFAAYLGGVIDLADSGVHVDHTCHNDTACPPGPCAHRACCNPSHHDATTPAENMNRSHNSNARKTHCPKGHEYTPQNTRIQMRGETRIRKCIACEQARFVPRPTEVRPLDVAVVVEQYQSGIGAVSIASNLGVSFNRIIRTLDEAGIKRRGPGRVPNRKEVAEWPEKHRSQSLGT